MLEIESFIFQGQFGNISSQSIDAKNNKFGLKSFIQPEYEQSWNPPRFSTLPIFEWKISISALTCRAHLSGQILRTQKGSKHIPPLTKFRFHLKSKILPAVFSSNVYQEVKSISLAIPIQSITVTDSRRRKSNFLTHATMQKRIKRGR